MLRPSIASADEIFHWLSRITRYNAASSQKTRLVLPEGAEVQKTAGFGSGNGRRRASVLAGAAPPRWDHVVVVIEENHAQTQIIGNTAQAPYINALANSGVQFSNFFAI